MGTFKTIDSLNTDRLGGGTGTSPVSQRSESGEGILGDKTGGVMLLWYELVVVVFSRMSVYGYSLSGSHDDESFLVNDNCE